MLTLDSVLSFIHNQRKFKGKIYNSKPNMRDLIERQAIHEFPSVLSVHEKWEVHMKIILLALIIFNSSAWADPVKNMTEVAMLPLYCRGTQQIREITKVDPTEYGAIYGQSYNHLHHYCWALNAENKANMMFDKRARDVTLGSALLDIKYVLKNADADFVLLPEIYNSQARILFSLHSDSEAVLALEKAIELKPGYVPAVTPL